MNIKNIKYELIKTKEDNPSIAVIMDGKRLPLHSKFYPSREPALTVEELGMDKYDMLIVLGVGLGYHLASLKQNLDKYSRIIIIDILGGIEKHISQISAASFLISPEVDFVTGCDADDVEEYLDSSIDFDFIRGIKVVEHTQSMRIFGDYYNSVKNVINRVINKKAGNSATKRAFGSLYLKNILKNLPCIADFKPVRGLFGAFSSQDALIITSGPSIENYFDDLKKYSDQLFIIAVDSALPVLSANGVRPDFVISIDPQAYILEHFQGEDIKDSVSLFSLSANSLLFNKRGMGQALLSLNSHPVSQIISELYPDSIGSIDSSTGSVAGDAVNFAYKLGFSSIGLIGFDFSFSDYKIYSRGTAYQKRYSLYFQDRLSTVERRNFDYIMKSSRGFRHSGKFSRKSFIQYKESLENFIRESGMGNLYSINNRGIAIGGVPNVSFEDFVPDFRPDINKSEIIEGILQGIEPIGTSVSIERVCSLLNEERFMNEVLSASLGEDIDEKKIEKFKIFMRCL